jgi:hypothetical protein
MGTEKDNQRGYHGLLRLHRTTLSCRYLQKHQYTASNMTIHRDTYSPTRHTQCTHCPIYHTHNIQAVHRFVPNHDRQHHRC